MESVYLGLFEKVFNWVLSRILDPVYRFVSGLLMTIFSWLFEEILAPVLMPVLEWALDFFIDLWLKIYSNHLYLLFSGLLKLIDYLETAFDVFIGLRDVTYTTANGTVVTGTLVEILMQQESISLIFWMITLGALGLALILTIYGTAKSAFDLDFENKRPVSKVMTAMMKTFIQFFTVPFLVYFLLKLSAVILKGVTGVMNFGNVTTLGRIVFIIASLKAAKNASFNVGSDIALDIEFGTSSEDTIRYPFYTIAGGNGVQVKDYGNISQVGEVFDLASFDYLVGFIAAVFLLFTLGVCLVIFVQRIFELILLYLVSPYFVCMMPLDDGEKFNRWREMFIGKCFTGFGSVIGMRLFLMVCPIVMSNRIQFGTAASPEMDYIMKLFFLAGGAWAMYKSGSMITSLLSYQAGSSEAGTAAVAGGMIFSHTVGYAMAKGRQAISAGMARGGKGRASGLQAGGTAAQGAGDGRFAGTKEPAGGGTKSPGLGKRIKNTMAAGSEAADNLRKLKQSVKGPDRNFKGAARQMVRTYDSLHNISRASEGKGKSSGLEMKIDRTVGAFRAGMSSLGADFDATEKSMRASRDSVGKTLKTMVGPGSFSDKMKSVGETARTVYGTSKQFTKIGQDYDKMKVNIGKAVHHREDLGAFKLTLGSDGMVLAKGFPGPPQSPVQDPEKLKINLGNLGLEGSLESSASSGGASEGGSPDDPKTPWKAGKVRPYQVRCTVPAVQKVTVVSGQTKVGYRSLSIRGVQFKGQSGNGQRTRRNSI